MAYLDLSMYFSAENTILWGQMHFPEHTSLNRTSCNAVNLDGPEQPQNVTPK